MTTTQPVRTSRRVPWVKIILAIVLVVVAGLVLLTVGLWVGVGHHEGHVSPASMGAVSVGRT